MTSKAHCSHTTKHSQPSRDFTEIAGDCESAKLTMYESHLQYAAFLGEAMWQVL